MAGVAVLPTAHVSIEANEDVLCNTLQVQVDYPKEELARIVLVTLSVDPELKPDTVKREMKVEGQRLTITFSSTEARFLRASFSAFMDLLILATRTVEEFGPGTKYME